MFCKREEIEQVAEQLLASQEGLFRVPLNVIHCKVLRVIMLRMYKGAAVSSDLVKLCAIPFLDRGHINIILVLQSCTDPLQILPCSSSENYATSFNGAYNSSKVEVEGDVDVKEEFFTAINKEAGIDIKQEEIPEETTFSGIKSEPDEVSSLCVYVY